MPGKKFKDDLSMNYYLKQIGERPLLSREKEPLLAQRIQRGDMKALTELTEANLRFVVSTAKKYLNSGLALADLVGAGNIGLIKAAKKFDASRGLKFISYAQYWIRQTILQEISEQSRAVRLPLNRTGTIHKVYKASSQSNLNQNRQLSSSEIAESLDIKEADVIEAQRLIGRDLSLDAPLGEGEDSTRLNLLENATTEHVEAQVRLTELRDALDVAKSDLTIREEEVVNLYYGIGCDKKHTLEEIGQKFHLTRERVRQIKEKALKRLRHPSRSRHLREFFYS
jgi:RNA polymerase primary sigma factor